MIKFNKPCQDGPYLVFKELYDNAIKKNQKNIEALSIASYSKITCEVNSRFVNLKFINKKEFIFFSNYKSQKSIEFNSHQQISALIYWNEANTQIRMKGTIKKTTKEFNQNYFLSRDKRKNALAISSKQSSITSSYEDVISNYQEVLEKENLAICPSYWGGYSFTPYLFEFWEGHNSRLNKRIQYQIMDGKWIKDYLHP
jgi:pyridoxamine 5'-phosphate oxidase